MKKSETPVRISAAGSAALSQRSGKTLGQRLLDNWQLYALLLIPVVVHPHVRHPNRLPRL